MHSCPHTAQIPRASDVTCIFLPEAGTGWEGLSHAGQRRQLTSLLADQNEQLPAPKNGHCQPLALLAPCSHQIQPRGGSFRTLSALM